MDKNKESYSALMRLNPFLEPSGKRNDNKSKPSPIQSEFLVSGHDGNGNYIDEVEIDITETTYYPNKIEFEKTTPDDGAEIFAFPQRQ